MDRPLPQPAGGPGVLEHRADAFPCRHEGQGTLQLRGVGNLALRAHLMEGPQVGGGDVEAFEGVGEPLRRQVVDQVVKAAQAPAHLAGGGGIVDHIQRAGVLQEGEGAPAGPVLLHPGVVALVHRNHQRHLPAAAIRPGGEALGPLRQMVAQGLDVAHHQVGAAEHMAVDPLQHKPDRALLPIHRDQVGGVDVAAAQRLDRPHRAREPEPPGDGRERIPGGLLRHGRS